jgi:hypothetical protein
MQKQLKGLEENAHKLWKVISKYFPDDTVRILVFGIQFWARKFRNEREEYYLLHHDIRPEICEMA